MLSSCILLITCNINYISENLNMCVILNMESNLLVKGGGVGVVWCTKFPPMQGPGEGSDWIGSIVYSLILHLQETVFTT